jgi:hypothetical protein
LLEQEGSLQGVDNGTAEEFFSRLVSNAQVLADAGRDYARDGEVVRAVACALGSDVATLESVVWERLNIAPRSPLRQFFQAAGAVSQEMSGIRDEQFVEEVTAADVVTAARIRLTTTFDETLVDEVRSHWRDLEHLSALPAPRQTDIAADVSRRLEGMDPRGFVHARREAAAASILDAQARRIRGAIAEGIQAAYDSDFQSLEAYLVESAVAAGDDALFTVTTRWVLVTHALAGLTSLPADFPDAIATIRDAMAEGLGEADGTRLRAVLASV